MSRRLGLPIVAVLGLVAIVAVVAHGRPLGAGSGAGGVPTAFWSYVLTTAIVLGGLVLLFLAVTVISHPQGFMKPRASPAAKVFRGIFGMLLFGLVVSYIVRHVRRHGSSDQNAGLGGSGRLAHHATQASSGVHIVWAEVLIVCGLLALALVLLLVRQSRRSALLPAHLRAQEAVAAALDVSLDDLRHDPDLRRSIIAAYARMESALAWAGVPREPAEAPLEYVERALRQLDVEGPPVRRLTELFEWAKFSHHEPEPSMRDAAVDALAAVRDALREHE